MPRFDDDPKVARARLAAKLGGYAPPRLALTGRAPLDLGWPDVRVERVSLSRGDGSSIRGVLTGPAVLWRHRPAVLYCHAHGHRHDIGASELIEGRPALSPYPYGRALAEAGIVALCIDMPTFGERRRTSESALSKQLLWQGRTLFGAMLEDLGGAFAVLTDLDGVDPSRIGVFGFSMGATQAFWLGALETRLSAVAHACSFADLATLVDLGAHDLHGHYMTTPGLLAVARTGQIAGLVAPRPQFIGLGLADPLTPEPAVRRGLADARQAYRAAGADDALICHVDPANGHIETPQLRAAVLDFLSATLRSQRPPENGIDAV